MAAIQCLMIVLFVCAIAKGLCGFAHMAYLYSKENRGK